MKDKIKAWFNVRNIKNYDVRLAMDVDGFEVRMFEKVRPGKVAVIRTVVSSEDHFDRLEWIVKTFNESKQSHWENVPESPYWLFNGESNDHDRESK